MSKHPTRQPNVSLHAFSLIEAAIVLGVVGLIVGGIWIGAAAVNDRMKWQQTEDGWLYYIQYINNTYQKSVISNLVGNVDIESRLRATLPLPAGWGCCGPYGSILDPYGQALFVQVKAGSYSMGYNTSTVSKKFCINWMNMMFNRVLGRLTQASFFNVSGVPNYSACMAGLDKFSNYTVDPNSPIPLSLIEQSCCPSSISISLRYPN